MQGSYYVFSTFALFIYYILLEHKYAALPYRGCILTPRRLQTKNKLTRSGISHDIDYY